MQLVSPQLEVTPAQDVDLAVSQIRRWVVPRSTKRTTRHEQQIGLGENRLEPLQCAGLSTSEEGCEGYNQYPWVAGGAEVQNGSSARLRINRVLIDPPNSIGVSSWGASKFANNQAYRAAEGLKLMIEAAAPYLSRPMQEAHRCSCIGILFGHSNLLWELFLCSKWIGAFHQ